MEKKQDEIKVKTTAFKSTVDKYHIAFENSTVGKYHVAFQNLENVYQEQEKDLTEIVKSLFCHLEDIGKKISKVIAKYPHSLDLSSRIALQEHRKELYMIKENQEKAMEIMKDAKILKNSMTAIRATISMLRTVKFQ